MQKISKTCDFDLSQTTNYFNQQIHENYYYRDGKPQCSSSRLTQAMTRLDPALREAFLFSYQGYTPEEIAHCLNVREVEVHQRITKAKTILNKLLS